MSKTKTKNKNLWSNDRLKLEYISAYRELKEWNSIITEWRKGTYKGNWEKHLNDNFIKLTYRSIINRLQSVEPYIIKRNEWNLKYEKPLITLIEWKKEKLDIDIEIKPPEPKPKTQEQIEIEQALDEIFKEFMED